MDRKKFIKQSTLGLVAGATVLSACSGEEKKSPTDINIISTKKYKWKMVTTWPPNFPVLGEVCSRFAEAVDVMSGGRLKIKVYGAGELIPALECFEAVSSGSAEMYNGVSYYWAGKAPATQFFSSIPFGMNAQQMHAWIMWGGGYELWRELYAKFNLVPFISGNTGVQMGGWFNKEINEPDDFKGLKMRMPGLGGKVLEKVGGTAVLVPGSELYTNLERGVIDATEWIGPYHDYLMGFHNIAKYYYAPGWHEPGSVLESVVNKRAFEGLPKDLQEIVRLAAEGLSMWCFHEFEAKNNDYLIKIQNESKAELRDFPTEVLDLLREKTKETIDELVSEDAMSKKVYNSFSTFSKNIRSWSKHSEKLYYQHLS